MKVKLNIKNLPGKGRAVMAAESILAGSLIETCPLLVVPADEFEHLTASALVDYFFFFDQDKGELALSLGYGSLYNHADHPNARYELSHAEKVMRYYALFDIAQDEEVTINYGGKPGESFEQWFASRGIKLLQNKG